MINKTKTQSNRPRWLAQINGPFHQQALWLFMVIVLGHWSEHLAQVFQIYVMGWLPKAAGGVIGLWFPQLITAEVLHTVYNFFLWGGLLLLRPGFQGEARRWWNGALILQSWHFFEHILLQVQWLTGYYLFGAAKQISIGELWFPRVELHFMYNLIVFVPMMIGMVRYFKRQAQTQTQTAPQSFSVA